MFTANTHLLPVSPGAQVESRNNDQQEMLHYTLIHVLHRGRCRGLSSIPSAPVTDARLDANTAQPGWYQPRTTVDPSCKVSRKGTRFIIEHVPKPARSASCSAVYERIHRLHDAAEITEMAFDAHWEATSERIRIHLTVGKTSMSPKQQRWMYDAKGAASRKLTGWSKCWRIEECAVPGTCRRKTKVKIRQTRRTRPRGWTRRIKRTIR